ncbi:MULTISPECIES: methyltransferase domain-containing protein [Streptomyces]|uniref:methyltransferase domain-containing protein n=1 Tax=Streptomyces TaxID=1883 RepID=UPI00287F8D32|nr:methyltransferase domain-containing protein [Streptomyces sp. CGMCC 4.1456]WNF63675.1 methyltransferase domain-containing protein [Streptomyces sp. CGMCC 4.1456]
MTTPPRHTRLTFHGPLSEARADRLISRLTRNSPTTVLDIGCGWAELMLRVLTAAPDATGTGVDIDAEALARGREAATARGLADRVRFVEGSATETPQDPADLVLCLGASQALGDRLPEALKELRLRVADGGRVLLGEGFWQRTPTPAELSGMWPDAAVTDHHDLATLVDLAIEAGFRPEWTETASLDEWEEFESAYLADVEVWLAEHPGHPLAAETRERADRHRARWLTYRGVLGLAYLTLVPTA